MPLYQLLKNAPNCSRRPEWFTAMAWRETHPALHLEIRTGAHEYAHTKHMQAPETELRHPVGFSCLAIQRPGRQTPRYFSRPPAPACDTYLLLPRPFWVCLARPLLTIQVSVSRQRSRSEDVTQPRAASCHQTVGVSQAVGASRVS